MIDLLYVAYNRLEYTRQSFAALLANTSWGFVERLFVADDDSSDGTADWLIDQAGRFDGGPEAPEIILNNGPFGGPVAAMNWYLAQPAGDAEVFAKIDNDIIVCPGWLDDMWQALTTRPVLDALGMQPDGSPPERCPAARDLDWAGHIGGVGLIRRRVFDTCQPRPNGRFGWSEYQGEHSRFTKAWADPPLPVFSLDRHPGEPWASLSAEYVAKGWQRPWPDDWPQEPLPPAYYDWWTPV